MKRGLVGVWAALWLSGAAFAQTPASDPVMANYHAYRAAMNSGDFAAAEAAAAAALNASETRDGDGGHTAVLAENLAVVRLYQHEPATAYAPALRAYRLIQAH